MLYRSIPFMQWHHGCHLNSRSMRQHFWVALPPLGLMSRLFDRGTQWVPLVISGKRVCCLYIQGSHSFMNTRFKDFQGLFKAPFILYQAPIKFTLQHIVSCNTLQYLTFHLNLTFTLTKFRVIMF